MATDFSVRLLAPIVRQCLWSSRQPSPTNRALTVVGPRTWNDLLDDVTSAEKMLSSFRQRLKTHKISSPDRVFDCTSTNLSSGSSSSRVGGLA